MKKIISLGLALLTLAASLAFLSLGVFAADEEETEEDVFPDYTTKVFATDADKLATMEKKLDKFGYELYIEPKTAEVAVVDKASGQALFTNPYSGSDEEQTSFSNSGQLQRQWHGKGIQFLCRCG